MKKSFVVITRSKFDQEDHDRILELAHRTMPIFKQQKGLLGLIFQESHDKTETCTYMHWDSEESHNACLSNPNFGPVNAEWHDLMTNGTMQFELQTYTVADSTGLSLKK